MTSSFELFNLFFIKVTIFDILDILVVAFVLYKLYFFTRFTRRANGRRPDFDFAGIAAGPAFQHGRDELAIPKFAHSVADRVCDYLSA